MEITVFIPSAQNSSKIFILIFLVFLLKNNVITQYLEDKDKEYDKEKEE